MILIRRRGFARRTIVSFVVSLCLLAAGASGASASTPVSLTIPQSTAFSILGYWCGGIGEQVYAAGFDPTSGYPAADVYLHTSCSSGGRGAHVALHSAWVAVTWDFAGNVLTHSTLGAAPSGLNPSFSATDAAGDRLYEGTGVATAYLVVVLPGTPGGIVAAQVGDQLQVGWTPAAATEKLISSSTITATPVGSSAPVLVATVAGSATSATVGPLQPATTYSVTVVSTDASGSSAASAPADVTTRVSSITPSAPTGLGAHWTAPLQPGDALAVSWAAPSPGDSPIDEYQVTVTAQGVDSGAPGPYMLTVSGTTLSTRIAIADSLDWTVQVRAHNAAGWDLGRQPWECLRPTAETQRDGRSRAEPDRPSPWTGASPSFKVATRRRASVVSDRVIGQACRVLRDSSVRDGVAERTRESRASPAYVASPVVMWAHA